MTILASKFDDVIFNYGNSRFTRSCTHLLLDVFEDIIAVQSDFFALIENLLFAALDDKIQGRIGISKCNICALKCELRMRRIKRNKNFRGC